jgi:PAS domain S-box-containing protein
MTPVNFQAFEALGALVIVLEPNGKIVHWNRACSLLTGSSLDEVRGKHVWELLREAEEISSLRNALARASSDGLPSTVENHLTAETGGQRLVAWSSSTVVGAHGDILWVVMTGIDLTPLGHDRDLHCAQALDLFEQAPDGIFVSDGNGDGRWQEFIHDISARKAREQESARLLTDMDSNRRWLQAVLDMAPLGILLLEPNGRLTFNRRAEELLGMSLSSTEGSAQYANRIFFPDGRPVPADRLVSARVLRNEETIVGEEYIVTRPDGSRIPVLGSAAPIRDAEGRTIGAVGVFQDMSGRMRSEELIRKNERLLNGIFEILPVGVWIADETGRIVRTNSAGLRIWAGARYVGVSEFDQYKAWWADTGKPIAAEEWALARALTRGETSIGELIRIQCFDGTFKTIINSALPLHDEQGRFTGAIVVNEDVTSLKEAEETLRRAVRAREEVLGVVAHDLRNPLNTILLQLERLCLPGKHSERPSQQVLERMQRTAMRMNRLIQDLLDVVRIDAGALTLERAPVSARGLLTELAEAQRALVSEASLELHLDMKGELPDLRADHDRLLQVLENLVGNAIKCTKPAGNITVGAAMKGSEVVFWVADTGIGISEESLPTLFDRFWQGRRADRRGAGLGLAIAKGIIEAHGGRIWVESQLGVGTTFFVTVPVGGDGPA